MSTATATRPATTAALDIQSMGILDFDAAIKANKMTMQEVLDVLDARIAKRKAAGKALVVKVVEYRNDLAQAIAMATKTTATVVPVPAYTQSSPAAAALPTDPEQLADLVFNTVGASNLVKVINRLTQRIAAA